MSDSIVTRTRSELGEALSAGDDPRAVVMTLGALHEGHLALVAAARDLVGADGQVIVTIFVNPLQFGAGEDFERYPRTLEADLAACAEAGVDVVFAPERDDMYPAGDPQVTIDPGPLGRELEGASRPEHFAGVLTVVAKLLNLTVPSHAVFGEKDYQQLTLVRRMAHDLEMPYEIVGVPTIREPDGLALSSRNRYLTADERIRALSLSRALGTAHDAAAGGPEATLDVARAVLDQETGIDVEYLELRGPDLAPAPTTGPARLLVAATLGDTRLIDNVELTFPG